MTYKERKVFAERELFWDLLSRILNPPCATYNALYATTARFVKQDSINFERTEHSTLDSSIIALMME